MAEQAPIGAEMQLGTLLWLLIEGGGTSARQIVYVYVFIYTYLCLMSIHHDPIHYI